MHRGGRDRDGSRSDPFTNMMFGSGRPPGQGAPQIFQQHQQAGQHPATYQGYAHGQYSHQTPYQQPQAHQSKKGVLSHFMKEDGTWDYVKIGNGVQQAYGIAGKVSPMVKQISPLLALLKK
ncbi:YppG family protein [Evansella sp. LMS18]|uniref:YppG family protein n=1 Tax=Evansella sp. LMS18 TaxID=2924033 RepID=UPI0020D1B669|nr:YppG family protein [Evansella sp. LMS18]UTR11212.1 YppG family protein [Evansella sp. LMS18]